MNDPRPNGPATISVWPDHALLYERLESQIKSGFVKKARVVLGASHGAACDCSIHIIDSIPGFCSVLADLHERFPAMARKLVARYTTAALVAGWVVWKANPARVLDALQAAFAHIALRHGAHESPA